MTRVGNRPSATLLQQHQRPPQREQHAHDDYGDEAHASERLALNVGDAEQEADGIAVSRQPAAPAATSAMRRGLHEGQMPLPLQENRKKEHDGTPEA